MQSNTLIVEFISTLDSLNQQGKMIPGLIMSSPGFGKTSSVEMYCTMKGYNCCTLIPSHYSPDDVLGLQSLVNGELVRLTPSWFKTLTEMASEKRTLLFIDEISTCDEFIQAPLLRLIFERKLDEKPLPENVFIISAGNYANELNNQFHLAAPTVNRFMILNLSHSDYDIFEVCDDRFSKVMSSGSVEAITRYVNTSDTPEGSTPKWDFNKIRKFISKRLEFNKPTIIDSTEDGLLGYCSIRSLNYSLLFIQEYASRYNGETWLRVAGDTLGTRQKTEEPLRKYLDSNKTRFLTSSETSSDGSSSGIDLKQEIYNLISDSSLEEKHQSLNTILEWIKTVNKEHMTQNERSQLSRLVASLSKPETLEKLEISPQDRNTVEWIINEYNSKF